MFAKITGLLIAAVRGHSASVVRALPLKRLTAAASLAAALVVLLAQIVGYAAAVPSALQYSKGFLVTGDYAVGSVDLTDSANPVDGEGLATGTIHLNDVPEDAEIVAAYLYWEAITFTSTPSQARVKFRGQEIPITDALAVKKASQNLVGSTASCWSSGTPLTMTQFRADVLRFLPLRLDKDNQPTAIRLVNDADLVEQGLPLNTVSLPTRNGNQIPEGAGASLVVVYRDPSQALRRIVFYDGIHIQSGLDEATTLTIRGFYKSSATPSAKITHLIGSGQPNNNERIFFNDSATPGPGTPKSPADPIMGGSSSQRGWSALTYDVSLQMNPGNNFGTFGETATTTVDHSPGGGYDCLALGAVIFSTAVADVDHDGLPDAVEDVSGGLTDPDNTQLANLKDMGAGSDQADLFVEANAMWAAPGTSYGSLTAPFNDTVPTKTDAFGHHHIPTPEMIQAIGDTYAGRGIRLHVDVGDVASYHSLGTVQHTDWVDDYTSTDADQYLVGNGLGTNVASLARGGEIIKERACDPTELNCHFPAYPGTVSWKLGFQLHRAWPVDDDGNEFSLDPSAPDFFDWNAGTHRVRFDRGRRGLFHYVLYGHARAKPKSLPCLINGHPADYDANNGTSCTTPNLDFKPLEYHVPSSTSGVADLPGNSVLVTLGLWDEFVARPFIRASTTLHELGHNKGLWHGGAPAEWGNKALNTPTFVEANCKPNYLSSMSYLFQVHGLFDDLDNIHLDYSSTVEGQINEGAALSDAALSPTPNYQPAWFAPAGSSLATMLGVSPAKRFCGGGTFGLTPPASTARVHALSSGASIDWDGDLDTTDDLAIANQDVNFDKTVSAERTSLFSGFNDWDAVRLDQLGAAAAGILPGSIEGSIDFAGGSIDYAGGSIDFAGGSIDFAGGSIDYAGGSIDYAGGSIDFAGGSIDFAGGSIDFAGGSIDFAGGSIDFAGGAQEVSFNLANELGKSRPYRVTACVIGRDASCETPASPNTALYHRVEVKFNAAPFGGFDNYQVQRKRAGAADNTFVTAGTTTTNLFVDTTELADTVQYVYRVRGKALDGDSEWSRPSLPVTAANNAPQAGDNGPFTVDNKATLPLPLATLLANDTDDDSPIPFIGRRVIVTVQPTHGTLTLNAAGTILTYTPTKNYVGPDSFKYRADDGLTSDAPQVPLSAQSNEVTVTINVVKR